MDAGRWVWVAGLTETKANSAWKLILMGVLAWAELGNIEEFDELKSLCGIKKYVNYKILFTILNLSSFQFWYFYWEKFLDKTYFSFSANCVLFVVKLNKRTNLKQTIDKWSEFYQVRETWFHSGELGLNEIKH